MLTKSQKGFTLIELLIVIVIIGILAGVLIAVINPSAQQNRAKDAGVKAAMNKVALAAEGFVSAYGRAPNDIEFIASITNAADATGARCNGTAGAGDQVCNFSVTGNTLPLKCGVAGVATEWHGSGANASQCYFHYYATAAPSTHFKVYAQSWGIANTTFMYDNGLGAIVECAGGTAADNDGTTCL